ncbi:MAG: FAD:protein FMN transferase [Kiritimatiellia bacterium]
MKVHKYEHEAMSTGFELMIKTGEEALAQSAAWTVFQKVDRLEKLFSRFMEGSDACIISRLKPGETYKVSPETMDLLLIATDVCAATDGAFDVTVGSVMDLLRDVKHRWKALSKEELDNALAACGMNRLIIDRENFLLGVTPDRTGGKQPTGLDFGAIAKGYALDVVARMLIEDWEFDNFLIHAGTSTVIAHGSMDDKPGWPVSVGGEWQKRAGIDAVRLNGGALSGSGFEVKGAHVVDVRKGVAAVRYPAAWSCASSAAVADALSTAVLGLNWKEIVSACDAIPGSGVMTVRGQPEWMDRFRRPVRICGIFPLE